MAEFILQSNGSSRGQKLINKRAKKHECLFCFQFFASAYHLKRHSIVHSTEKKIFHCQFCESSFRLHKELLSHESTHKRTLADTNLKRCKICGIACYNDKLVEHLKNHHEHFECDICNNVYSTKTHIKLHMAIHINAREFKCSLCPKAFNFISQMKRHERSHSTIAVWYCEICGVGFKNKPSLAHHMRSHNGEKPFQCDRCDRCFSAKQSLRLHIRIHNGERPYKCPWAECGRCFNDSATMKVHTRLHTNENPYKCHLCGKTTKQASNLKSHYLHAHKIKDITSKTIRSNARLLEKYKKENLTEVGMLEMLSQQVQRNFAKIENEKCKANISNSRNDNVVFNRATTETINQIAKVRLHMEHGDTEVKTEVDAIRNEESNENGSSIVVSTSNVQSDAVIKEEVALICENTSCEDESEINGLNRTDVPVVIPSIKEEAPDTADRASIIELKCLKKTSKPLSVKTHSKSDRTRQNIISMKRKAVDIEEVFIDEENSSILSNEIQVKQEFVIDENVEECMTIKIEDSARGCDGEVQQEQSKDFSSRSERKLTRKCARISVSSSSLSIDNVVAVPVLQKRSSFKCDLCPRTFKLELKLERHKQSHTSIPANKIKMCDICGKTYSQNSALQKHLKFTHSNYRPFPCILCDRAFKDSTGLKVHQRSHSGEKPYNCSFCPKSFSTSMGRNLHQRGHTGDKPYKCQYCDSSFSDNSTYRQHVRVHTGEKPYVCHLCGKGTTQAGNLKSHLRHAHKILIKNVTMTRK